MGAPAAGPSTEGADRPIDPARTGIVRPMRIHRRRTAVQRDGRSSRAGSSGSGARPAYKPNARENHPPNANPQVANRGPSHQMGAPAEAHPGAGARSAHNPKAPAPQAMRNKPEPQARQANPYRGFAKAPAPGLNKTAFARIAPGGEAIAASARGRASLGAGTQAGSRCGATRARRPCRRATRTCRARRRATYRAGPS